MGFSDEAFYKAKQVNSNHQLYKQAGNSIVVNVLEAIFENLLIKNECKKMNIIKKEELEELRDKYKVGSRVKLIFMDDKFAPPAGTLGTVIGVDDIGSIMVAWDNGSGLYVAYGIDRCELVENAAM